MSTEGKSHGQINGQMNGQTGGKIEGQMRIIWRLTLDVSITAPSRRIRSEIVCKTTTTEDDEKLRTTSSG